MDKEQNAREKTLSIIIPCFNEEKTLNDCVTRVMESLCDLVFLEVIIVDDGSTDGSLMIAESLEKRYPEVNQHSTGIGAHP